MPNNNLTAGIQCQELPGPGGPPPLPGVTRNRFAKYPGQPGVGISRIISRGQHWAGTCPDIGVTILGDIVPVTVTWHSLPPAGRVSPTRQQQDCTTSTVQREAISPLPCSSDQGIAPAAWWTPLQWMLQTGLGAGFMDQERRPLSSCPLPTTCPTPCPDPANGSQFRHVAT